MKWPAWANVWIVCWLVLIPCARLPLAAGQNSPPPQQRIPRQSTPATGVIQGVVKNETGLGLGATVVIRNLNTGQSEPVGPTTGDGVFRVFNLPPGRYEVQVQREGFNAFSRNDIQLGPGDVFTVEVKLTAISTGKDGVREIPSSPLPPPPPEPPVEPAGTYHSPLSEPPPPPTVEPLPLPPLADDDKVFSPAVTNRWGYKWPAYRRYSMQDGEIPWTVGHFIDPFDKNTIKGDYPILGNETFFEFNGISETDTDGRKLPTPSNIGSARPNSPQFFGQFGQFFMDENITLSMNLFHGDTLSFRPVDWRVEFTPEINLNYLNTSENGIVNPDVRKGTTRFDEHIGLQEGFVEVKLKDLSGAYDFVSLRAGIQHFNSDFRGFIFNDEEPGVRIFGNFDNNRYQFNAAAFAMLEKDSNSGLNTFQYRHQNVFIANLYRQDFVWHGYTLQGSFHYDKDDPSFLFSTDNFLVRPAPIGRFTPHSIRAYYYGVTGDGHIGRINVNHAFYEVLGTDKDNLIANRPLPNSKVHINGQMAAVELSLDRDWIRYRVSGFYSSGDGKPTDRTATGFDTIFDNPNFAGGIFSFWNREGIPLTGAGVSLVSPGSLVPDLKTSKLQGQANFVNPGLMLINAGTDIELTPKLRGFVNFNAMRFAHTQPLELLLFQQGIHAGLGLDSGVGVIYRPPLSENITITGGVSMFNPFQGFRDIYQGQVLFSTFVTARFKF